MPEEREKLLTFAAVAELLGVRPLDVWRLYEGGRLPAVELADGRILFRASDVKKIVKERESD